MPRKPKDDEMIEEEIDAYGEVTNRSHLRGSERNNNNDRTEAPSTTAPPTNQTSTMGTRGSSSVRGSETKLTPFEKPHYGIPHAHTVFHTLTTTFRMHSGDVDEGTLEQGMSRVVIRMNSLWDPFVNTATEGNATGAPVAVSGDEPRLDGHTTHTIDAPSYRAYYAQYYDYYSVLGCKWELVARMRSQDINNIGVIKYHYHGSKHPPNRPRHRDTIYWKDMSRDYPIYPQNALYPYPLVRIEDGYKCGTHHGILDDATATVWTATGSVASHPEFLSIYYGNHMMSEEENDTRATEVTIQLTLSYLVQWKDVEYNWQYYRSNNRPTIGTPGGANYHPQNTLATNIE